MSDPLRSIHQPDLLALPMTPPQLLGTRLRASLRQIPGVEVGAVAVIAASYAMVWPVGKYAVLDDWTYMKSLARLHADGRLQVLDINPISVVGLVLWAWPFTKILGFSFTVARFSVVVLHVIECLALVRLLRLCEVRGSLALAAVMTLIFNPLHFFHSFTFLSDVPAVAWQTVAAFFYARAIGRGESTRPAWLLCGSLAAAMAFLVRQSGIVVPLAFIGYAVLFDRSCLHWRSLAAGLGPFAAIAGGFACWYAYARGPTSTFELKANHCLEFWAHAQTSEVAFLCFAIVAYLGFFLCPLSLVTSRRSDRTGGKTPILFLLLAWGLLNLFAYYYLSDGRLFPYFINVITRFGFFTTNDVIIGDRDVVWGDTVQWAMNAAVLGSLLALVYAACSYPWRAPKKGIAGRVLRLLVVLLALQFLYSLATAPVLFDRHLLILLPTTIAIFCLQVRETARPVRGWFFLAIAPMVFYSIAAAHDVYAMSRAAFAAGDALIAEGVDPKFIDGGYAFDGWYMYERQGQDARPRRPSDPWWLREFFHGIDEEYMVTSSTSYDAARYQGKVRVPPGPSLKDREVYKSYSYRGFWPWKVQWVYVMKRRSTNPKATQAIAPTARARSKYNSAHSRALQLP